MNGPYDEYEANEMVLDKQSFEAYDSEEELEEAKEYGV